MATCPTCRVRFEDTVTVCPTHGEALLPDQSFTLADVELAAGDVVGEYRRPRRRRPGRSS